MNIIVCGNDDNLIFSKTLCRLLFKFGGALLLSDKAVADYSLKDNDFTVFETEALPEILFDSGIVIFKENPQFFALPHAERLFYISNFNEGSPNTFVCSMSKDSDLTVSSVQDGKIMISLLREKASATGKKIEPCEIAVLTEESFDSYPLLCFVAILLISGKISSNEIKI